MAGPGANKPNSPVSLVRLKLLTGYKHQLRVHMARCLQSEPHAWSSSLLLKGHAAPILGDSLHSQTRLSDSISKVTSVPKDRVFLHASRLSIFVGGVSFRIPFIVLIHVSEVQEIRS